MSGAEMGVTCPQIQGRHGLLAGPRETCVEQTRVWRKQPCRHLCFWTSVLRGCEKMNFCCVKPLVFGTLFQQPKKAKEKRFRATPCTRSRSLVSDPLPSPRLSSPASSESRLQEMWATQNNHSAREKTRTHRDLEDLM